MNTFHKQERLCLQKEIDALFKEGSNFLIYPYKVVWKIENDNKNETLTVLISVSKRYFKRAVHRNRVKRLTKEAWRKNILKQAGLNLKSGTRLNLALLYVGKEIMTQTQIEIKINLILQRLLRETVKCQESSTQH
jgi:ribonuclease P protein component